MMHRWRRYKKWKGQENELAICCFLDCCNATYEFYGFRRFKSLLKAYQQSRPTWLRR